MPRSRLPQLVTLGTFLLMAACTPGPTTPDMTQGTTRARSTTAPHSSPSTSDTAVPTGSPSTSDTATPSPTPSASATATPTPSASGTQAPTVTSLSGTVYDDQKRAVANAMISIVALNGSFNDTLMTDASGHYSLDKPPTSVQLSIKVSKVGFTTRQRVESLSENVAAVSNFGGATSANDTAAPAYFISDYPEIESVTPLDESAGNSATTESYSLTLSEPLDPTNTALFERAVRIWPANAAASPLGNPAPVLLNASATADQIAALPLVDSYANGNYAVLASATVQASSQFGDVSHAAQAITYSGQLVLTFRAPLIDNNGSSPRYQIGLAHMPGAPAIQDAAGHVMGTGPSGTPGSAPGTSDANAELIDDAFQAPILSGSTWASTHETVAYFDLTRDTTLPTLQALAANSANNQTVLRLTFNKPMGAYGGNPDTNGEYLSSTARNPANYIFAFGQTSNDVSGVALNGGSPQTANSFAQVATGTPMIFANSAVTIDVDPANPAAVRLTAAAGDVLPANIATMKVRVVNVQDPAGNAIVDTDNASSNVQTGTL